MRRWSEVADRVAAVSSTSAKTTILADYLVGLGPDDVRKRLRNILDRVKPAGHGIIVRDIPQP